MCSTSLSLCRTLCLRVAFCWALDSLARKPSLRAGACCAGSCRGASSRPQRVRASASRVQVHVHFTNARSMLLRYQLKNVDRLCDLDVHVVGRPLAGVWCASCGARSVRHRASLASRRHRRIWYVCSLARPLVQPLVALFFSSLSSNRHFAHTKQTEIETGINIAHRHSFLADDAPGELPPLPSAIAWRAERRRYTLLRVASFVSLSSFLVHSINIGENKTKTKPTFLRFCKVDFVRFTCFWFLRLWHSHRLCC